jgi:ketosteroid isomerase-like protein
MRGWREVATIGTPILLAVATGCGGAPAGDAGADAAVRAVLEAQQAAWNRGDLDGFMEGYWKSDSLVFESGGNVRRGWNTTRERYIATYQSPGHEMGTLGLEIGEITVLGSDRAQVKGAWRLTRSTDSPHGTFRLQFRRFPEAGWKIVHDHTE